MLFCVIVISYGSNRNPTIWTSLCGKKRSGEERETRSRAKLTYASCHQPRPLNPFAPLKSSPHTTLFRFTRVITPRHSGRTGREMSWMSTDMNTDTDGSSSEMSYTSSLQYLNSQLVAHGFAHNPGISLDGLSTSNMESAVKVLLSLVNQRVVRLFLLFAGWVN